MLSKRTIMKWRKETLIHQKLKRTYLTDIETKMYIKRVLVLTQILIDQQLIEEDNEMKAANLPY
mgnify:CR=1 FL=1